jgi:hypothetical protein
MGLFDSLFGSKQKNTSQTTQSQKFDQQGTTASQQQGAQLSGTSGQQTQQVSALDADVQAAIKQLILGQASGSGALSLSGGQAPAELAEAARLILGRAGESDAFYAGNSAAILDEARRSGKKEVDQITQALTRGAGSSLNSFVAQAKIEGSNELESRLGALDADLRQRGRAAASSDLNAGYGALSDALKSGVDLQTSGVQNLSALAAILKGAQTTAQTTSEEQSFNLSQILDLLAQMESGTSSGKSSSSGTTKGSGGIFGQVMGGLGAVFG